MSICKRNSARKSARCRNRACRRTRFDGKCRTETTRTLREGQDSLECASAVLDYVSKLLRRTRRRDRRELVELTNQALRLVLDSMSRLQRLQADV